LRKLAFLQNEPLSRFGVALLLAGGVVLPLLLALDLGGYAPVALLMTLAVLVLLTLLGTTKASRKLLWILLGATAVLQFMLPGLGLLGAWVEAFKALALYFSSYTVALPLFGFQVASLIAVLSAALSYVFAKRGVGFLPAALVVVLVMFGLWSLGKGDLLWYVAPALVGLLLQMSQGAHEKINILHVLPMALVTVLVALLLLPGSRVVIDPLAKAASSLKQMISDYLFFTEPRDVFTLGTYGYYPMGNGQLGGAAEPSEYPVMMVKTDQKLLLRAVAKDQYSGRSFTDTSSAKRYLYINPRWEKQRRKVFMEGLPSEAIRNASSLLDQKAITVQMENSAASTVFTPLFLRSLKMENDMVPYFNDSSELFITRDLKLGDRYTVFTPVLEGGENGLEALVNASAKNDEYYASILSAYTQLPDHMEQKVFNDVANIVKNETTPYGKAMAIMRNLQKYYRYTLTPETPPNNLDFVTYFLYVGKEGYCTYYAAAMTVMCRMAGLPARYIEGFLAQPSADGFAYVTGKDAHAWTEVYFEGFGWVPFDPTPLQQSGDNLPPQGDQEPSPSPTPSPEDQPTPTPDPNQPEDQPSEEPSPEPSQEPEDNPDQSDSEQNPNDFPWWALIAAAAAIALTVRVALRSPDAVAKRAATPKDQIFVYGAAVQRLLMYAKRTPRNGETPLVFARRVDSVRVFPAPITPLWRMLALSNYSRMEPTAEQAKKAAETFHQVFKGSHVLRRIRFRLRAAFDPRFYHSLETPAPRHEPPNGTTIRRVGKSMRANAALYSRGGKPAGGEKPDSQSGKTQPGKPANAQDRSHREGASPAERSPAKQPKADRPQATGQVLDKAKKQAPPPHVGAERGLSKPDRHQPTPSQPGDRSATPKPILPASGTPRQAQSVRSPAATRETKPPASGAPRQTQPVRGPAATRETKPNSDTRDSRDGHNPPKRQG